MADRQLEGKAILVTGGADGIGRECVLAYVRQGARVIVADINLAKAQATAEEAGAGCTAVQCDVTCADSVQQAVQAALASHGRIDGLHNNAGIVGPVKPLHETSEPEWDDVLRVNLKSVYQTTRYAIDALRETKGSILNTASMVGLMGQSNHAAYVAAKGGMISLTKAMALDYAPWGVRVNAICPAGVLTPMLERWAMEQPDPEQIHVYLNEIHALGYCPRGDVVADAAVFLLSDQARFITGCILPVSGGAELGYRRI
jgi:meso-butanediol dehydrogenase / (S,S)-butanediol dehydrogenase / diacetyl reductase